MIFTSALSAQANWHPATLTIDGKEIQGEVNDREWPYHIDEISFRTDQGSTPTVYTPADEVTIEVSGRRFVTRSVSYITNTRDLAKLTRDTVFNRATERVFLRQYYGGALALYQYVDRLEKRHFYIQKTNAPMVYLEYELRLREKPVMDI